MTINNPIIIIPARMGSTRLPNKTLADINGKPMVVHTYERAKEAGFAEVLVACDDQRTMDAIEGIGGNAIMTDPEIPTGSDRIYTALLEFDPEGKYDCIINLQGDEPATKPENLKLAYDLLKETGADIATLGAIMHADYISDPSAVKCVVEIKEGETKGRALYFTRVQAPANEGDYIHHIGLYAYTRDALTRFVNTPQGELEKREKLEQLRALGMGMHMELALVNERPLGVDTQEDLERARRELK